MFYIHINILLNNLIMILVNNILVNSLIIILVNIVYTNVLLVFSCINKVSIL